MLSVAVSLVGGLLFGYLFLDTGVKDTLDLILMSALDVMIFIAGIEIGSNRGILKRICNLHSALLALAIPLAVACGSICGALLLGHIAVYKYIQHILSVLQNKICISSYNDAALLFCDLQNHLSLCFVHHIFHGFSGDVTSCKRIGKQSFLRRQFCLFFNIFR